VADELRRIGFVKARYLIGGVDAWKKTGFPLAAETAGQAGGTPHDSVA
jgi:rhodanese-related sulfurtransferase